MDEKESYITKLKSKLDKANTDMKQAQAAHTTRERELSQTLDERQRQLEENNRLNTKLKVTPVLETHSFSILFISYKFVKGFLAITLLLLVISS